MSECPASGEECGDTVQQNLPYIRWTIVSVLTYRFALLEIRDNRNHAAPSQASKPFDGGRCDHLRRYFQLESKYTQLSISQILGGLAGCVIAGRLAEASKDLSILVIEQVWSCQLQRLSSAGANPLVGPQFLSSTGSVSPPCRIDNENDHNLTHLFAGCIPHYTRGTYGQVANSRSSIRPSSPKSLQEELQLCQAVGRSVEGVPSIGWYTREDSVAISIPGRPKAGVLKSSRHS